MSASEDKLLDVKLLGHKLYAVFVILIGVANLPSLQVVSIYTPLPKWYSSTLNHFDTLT